MNRKYIVFYLILIFSFIGFSHGFAEDGAEDIVSVPRQLSLFLVFKGDFEQDEIVLLKQTLLIKLAEDKDISLVEPVIAEELTPDQRHIKADELGADCWLAAQVTAKTEIIDIVYSSYDLINSVFMIEEKEFEKDRKIRSLDRSFWKDIVIDVAQKYSQITGKLEIKEVIEYQTETKDAIEQKGVKVVIEANPGTRIQGLSADTLVVNDRGIAKIELPQASTYKMKASCSGFYPLEKSFYVGFEPVKITLEQQPASWIAFDVYLHHVDYLGAGFLFYILPNYFYVELSMTTYIKKLIWPVARDDERDYESPLFPVFLTTGFYVNEEDRFFRYGFNVGAFIRFLYHEKKERIIPDPNSSWGLKLLGFHAEFSGYKKIRFFYEHNILVYITEDVNRLIAAIDGDPGSGGIIMGNFFGNFRSAVTFWDIKLGVRFIL